jgi:hypothetical protein
MLKIKASTKLPQKLLDIMSKYKDKATSVIAPALYQEAEAIMTQAKMLTPVDTGALRASGHVRRPVVSAQSVSVTLGFGGTAAPYAVYVHEDLTKRHPVGQAKYLEQPFNAAKQSMAERIANKVAREIK